MDVLLINFLPLEQVNEQAGGFLDQLFGGLVDGGQARPDILCQAHIIIAADRKLGGDAQS